jgi:hypothetical protein
LRKLYNNIDGISKSTPIPCISDVKGNPEIFEYKLESISEDELYCFDTKQQQLLLEKYDVTIAHVFNVMKQVNKSITNLQLKNLELSLTLIDEQLDIDHLIAESKEWAASHYLKWRDEVPYRIHIYDGKIPYTLKFMGQVIKIIRLGNAVVFDKNAFVNSHTANIEEALFDASSRNSLSELMLLQLLRYKNETEPNTQKQPVIEKIIEKVVLPEMISDDEEILENPKLEKLLELKGNNSKGMLKMSFDLNDLTAEMTEQLIKLSKSTRIIVERDVKKLS